VAGTRPMLNPSLTPLWRDHDTLQIGLDPAHAVVLSGMTAPRTTLLGRLDGSMTRDQVLTAAAVDGLGPAEADELLDLLGEAGVLLDGGDDLRLLAAMATAERDRLAPDLASWACGGATKGPLGEAAAAATLARRQSALVGVRGAGRVGATVIGLLAAAGVGQLTVSDSRPMRARDVAPGGASASDAPMTRADAARAAARATAPAVSFGPEADRRVDLLVLCPDGPGIDPAEHERLLGDGVVHLLAATYERVGVVGPLVVPGRSACLRCLDLHRADRDRAWPMVSAQLAAPGKALRTATGVAACDVVLAAAVASHAAMAALAHLDDPCEQSALGGVQMELRPPLGHPRRRRWSPHPCCGCGWQNAPDQDAG
jgi:hypothetical protein